MENMETEILKSNQILKDNEKTTPIIINTNNNNQESLVNEYFNDDDILTIDLKYFFEQENELKNNLFNRYSYTKTNDDMLIARLFDEILDILDNKNILLYNLDKISNQLSLVMKRLHEYRDMFSQCKKNLIVIINSEQINSFLHDNELLSYHYENFINYIPKFDLIYDDYKEILKK